MNGWRKSGSKILFQEICKSLSKFLVTFIFYIEFIIPPFCLNKKNKKQKDSFVFQIMWNEWKEQINLAVNVKIQPFCFGKHIVSKNVIKVIIFR
jgi:hypothetical protein